MPKNPPPETARVLSKMTELLCSRQILADEKPVSEFPTTQTLREVLLPLLEWCADHPAKPAGQAPTAIPPFPPILPIAPIVPIPPSRGLVGIAAPPGGGKTLLLAWLAATAKALEREEFAFLPLDGYHFPNAALDGRMGLDPEGNPVSLRKLKGTPPTFDAERLLADLRALKSDPRERRLPGYSRMLHEPVPDRIRIGQEVKWVFVEGNFLFLDQPPWREIRDLFDRKIFIDADDAVLRERLARRHAAAGRDAEWIENHFRRTDGPNIRLSRDSARFADVVLRISDCRFPIAEC
jgi:pantothenate kinase